jgi:UDP-MurNAc hydroxylase
LRADGFTDLIEIPDRAQAELGPFTLTMYAAFSKNPFHDAQVGNLIDSSLVIDDGRHSVFDTNDNKLDEETCQDFISRHGQVSVAQLNYNAAGPFPSCFRNLDAAAKQTAHEAVLSRNLDHMASMAKILRPEYVMPFAGDFVLGGSQWRKNAALGTTTWDAASRYLEKTLPEQKVILLREGLCFDVDAGQIVNGTYEPVNLTERGRYISEVLSQYSYPHEGDAHVDNADLEVELYSARSRLWSTQEKFGYREDLNVYLNLGDDRFSFNMSRPDALCENATNPLDEPCIEIFMDARLLRRIVTRKAHWNNGEIGCHIEFDRRPDRYSYDFHQMMSFFHV